MRKGVQLITKHRGIDYKTSGSDRFVSRFDGKAGAGVSVSRAERNYYLDYRYKVGFAVVVLVLTSLVMSWVM